MRILQVVEFFAPSMGGSAQVAYQTARHLARRGHQVTVWSSDHPARNSAFAGASFETLLFPCRMARWGLYFTPELVGWARHHVGRFEIIHLHNVRTFQNAVVSSLARPRGIPYVLSAHGSLSRRVGRRGTKRAFDLLLGRRLLAGSRRVVAVSSLEVDQYRQAGAPAEAITVIPNGLDVEEFTHLPPAGTFRAARGIAPGAALVLFLGRLHPIKGIDLLIRAFAGLCARQRDSVLAIAGPDGGDRARLEALAARLRLGRAVHFPGPLYGVDKLAAYVDADVLVSPAAYEIFGLVPFEALMCGTPAIVCDGTGAGRLIREAGAGLGVPAGDPGALAEAIARTLGDPLLARETVRAGQAYVRRTLDWTIIAGQVERLYAEALDRAGRGQPSA